MSERCALCGTPCNVVGDGTRRYEPVLEEIGRKLLREYDAEEIEHGFPFNFRLRDAHEELRKALSDGASDEGDGG